MAYYHVKIYTVENPNYWQWVDDLSFEMIRHRVLVPYQEGRPITLRGRTTRLEEIERITIEETDESWQDQSVCRDVTDELITGPPGVVKGPDHGGSKGSFPPPDSRHVFVVHGRNEKARVALFTFLHSVGLDPLEWSEAVQAAGQPTPYVGEILNAAFARAHAVIVLLTPDDEACLKQQFRSENDPKYEVEPTGQARPNVLFEAGMAMGRDSNRTILVELGAVRPFSDIGARHILRLDNTSQQRQQLAQRLETAGCPVNLDGIEWHTAGDFDAAVKLTQDTSSCGYRRAAHRDSKAVGESVREREDQAFINAITDSNDE